MRFPWTCGLRRSTLILHGSPARLLTRTHFVLQRLQPGECVVAVPQRRTDRRSMALDLAAIPAHPLNPRTTTAALLFKKSRLLIVVPSQSLRLAGSVPQQLPQHLECWHFSLGGGKGLPPSKSRNRWAFASFYFGRDAILYARWRKKKKPISKCGFTTLLASSLDIQLPQSRDCGIAQ